VKSGRLTNDVFDLRNKTRTELVLVRPTRHQSRGC